MSANNTEPKTIQLDRPLAYKDSPNIPEEHRERLAEHIQQLDDGIKQFHRSAQACYEAIDVKELEKRLEELEPEMRKEFFYGLAATTSTGLPERSVLWEVFHLAKTNPKEAAQWCAELDPEYGKAYAMGWTRKQQMLIMMGLPNDASALMEGRALGDTRTEATRQLESEPHSLQKTLEKAKGWLLEQKNKKEDPEPEPEPEPNKQSLLARVTEKTKKAGRWLLNLKRNKEKEKHHG